MDKQQLLSALESLHAELADADQIDTETRERLETVTGDVQRLLGQDAEPSREEVEPLSDSLQDMVLRFEADHPSLTSLLNRIASGLSNLGI